MATTTRDPKNDTPADDLDDRDVRALTEELTVRDSVGHVKDADDMYLVVGESGNEYTVDLRSRVCDGPDFNYRDEVDRCKHIRACEFATGKRPIPAWVDRGAINNSLGAHIDAAPTFEADADTDTGASADTGRALTDGGMAAMETEGADCDHPDCQRGMDVERPILCFPCWKQRQDQLAAENAPR